MINKWDLPNNRAAPLSTTTGPSPDPSPAGRGVITELPLTSCCSLLVVLFAVVSHVFLHSLSPYFICLNTSVQYVHSVYLCLSVILSINIKAQSGPSPVPSPVGRGVITEIPLSACCSLLTMLFTVVSHVVLHTLLPYLYILKAQLSMFILSSFVILSFCLNTLKTLLNFFSLSFYASMSLCLSSCSHQGEEELFISII